MELGPYNRHYAWAYPEAGLILGNRHICDLDKAKGITLTSNLVFVEDVVVHELCHFRQARLEATSGKRNRKRGDHRDPTWYQAISEASRGFLGVEFPPDRWPKMKSTRNGNKILKEIDPSRISEVDACHWPHNFRELIRKHDPRLKNVDH